MTNRTYCTTTIISSHQYRAEISAWIFIWTVLGVLFITIMTVSFQAIKPAVANPIESLRTE